MKKNKSVRPRTIKLEINSVGIPVIEFNENEQVLTISGIKNLG